MDEFREFQGKDLDACIRDACAFFDSPREKLEVEIIQDAKSGIFGIVGARKAKIRARRARLAESMLDFLESGEQRPPRKQRREKAGRQQSPESGKSFQAKPAPRPEPEQAPERKPAPAPREAEREEFGEGSFENLNRDDILNLATETVAKLLGPIAGREIDVVSEIGHGLVRVNVAWEGDAGLLIGREGQTLAALQYIASRILSHALDTGVRIQLEIGDYKSRQDEKLRERAHILAEKARQTGRPWSTQPLSSYHRRIVHMELQEEPGIITRSAGEGMMKKVVISPRRQADNA